MNENKDWMLQQLSINQNWQKKGCYEGNITFQNGVKMQFSMVLDQAKCTRLIEVLREEITESAKNLGQAMINSMPIQISETTKQGENNKTTHAN